MFCFRVDRDRERDPEDLDHGQRTDRDHLVGANGADTNDAMDTDTGSNNLQNYPVIRVR